MADKYTFDIFLIYAMAQYFLNYVTSEIVPQGYLQSQKFFSTRTLSKGGESPNFTCVSGKWLSDNGKEGISIAIPNHCQEESTPHGEKLLEPTPSPSP